ncbi:uncharacterized protein LOC143035019 [Oratosquilla oratoria]|uniref:uncharacterized protein LOC143035019 n=1 Tax=Oratosquilla oratoria TaxID=337810 RepID=UPI003F76D961
MCDKEIKFASALGVDRTFNLGPCYVTTMVYKNTKLKRKTTQEPPVFLGPMLLHWDGEYFTYQRFFSHIQAKLSSGIDRASLGFSELVVGSDEEKAIVKAMKECFPGATFMLCAQHLEENTKRKLSAIGITKTKCVNQDIFEASGILTQPDDFAFEQRALELKAKLNQIAPSFMDYFENKLLPALRDYVHRPKAQNDFLPFSWTNNNCESMNNILKHSINWNPRKLPELIDKLHGVVKLQELDTKRALYQKGNYEVAGWVEKFRANDMVWNSKTEEGTKECNLRKVSKLQTEESAEYPHRFN